MNYKNQLLNLSSQRLNFRKLTSKDVSEWMEFFGSDKALEFLPFEKNNKDQCADWINRQIFVRYPLDDLGLYAVIEIESGKLIGQCGLLRQEVDGKEELEIGYHLIPRFWKKGYATEAAVAFKNFAFQNNLAESLISIIHIDNINSQKVAERNGMKQEKQTVFREMPIYIYRILKTEWRTN